MLKKLVHSWWNNYLCTMKLPLIKYFTNSKQYVYQFGFCMKSPKIRSFAKSLPVKFGSSQVDKTWPLSPLERQGTLSHSHTGECHPSPFAAMEEFLPESVACWKSASGSWNETCQSNKKNTKLRNLQQIKFSDKGYLF